MMPFRMTTRSMTLWQWLRPLCLKFFVDFVVGRDFTNIYTPSVFCYDEHKKNFDIHFFHEETYVAYEPAAPAAVY